MARMATGACGGYIQTCLIQTTGRYATGYATAQYRAIHTSWASLPREEPNGNQRFGPPGCRRFARAEHLQRPKRVMDRQSSIWMNFSRHCCCVDVHFWPLGQEVSTPKSLLSHIRTMASTNRVDEDRYDWIGLLGGKVGIKAAAE